MSDQLLIRWFCEGLGRIHQLLQELAVVIILGLGPREHMGQVTLDVPGSAAATGSL